MVTLFQTLHTLSYVTADRVSDRLQTLKDDERGASAVEYALLVGAIAVVLAVAAVTLSNKIGAALGKILP